MAQKKYFAGTKIAMKGWVLYVSEDGGKTKIPFKYFVSREALRLEARNLNAAIIAEARKAEQRAEAAY